MIATSEFRTFDYLVAYGHGGFLGRFRSGSFLRSMMPAVGWVFHAGARHPVSPTRLGARPRQASPRPSRSEARERRFEQRFPTVVRELPHFMQGYDRSPESAATILAFLERHWEVNLAMAQAIRGLLPAHLVAPGEGEGNRKGGQ